MENPDIKYTKLDDTWRKATLDDLDRGLEYIRVDANMYSKDDYNKIKFRIETIRGQLRLSNGKFEMLHKYTEYKNVIKKWTNEGSIFVKKKVKKVEEVKVIQPEVIVKTLFD